MGMAPASFSPLYGVRGERKYLTSAERGRFLASAAGLRISDRLFCLTLAWSGARISEVLALTPAAFDLDRGVVAIATLKRRRRGVVREVILPPELVAALDRHFRLRECQAEASAGGARLWPVCRQTAWRLVKRLMAAAQVAPSAAMPKGLRHGFAVAALQSLVPAPLVQRWLGHASLRTTAIYSDVAGDEEQGFARRMWQGEGAAMGHWEQIGAENRQIRAKRASWPWWRRRGRTALLVIVALAFLLVYLAPLWRWLL